MVGGIRKLAPCPTVIFKNLIGRDLFLSAGSRNVDSVTFFSLKIVISTVLCRIQGFSPINENSLAVIESLFLS